MHPVEVLAALKECRRDEVVITTMGVEREWLKMSQHPRDFFYVPSSMGQAPTFGLGLALARPDLRVVVLNGDGCTLMNLGCLVTIAEQAPSNYSLIVFENGVYEVTGGQHLAGSGRVDFAVLARGAGFRNVSSVRDISSWKLAARRILHGPGLEFAVVRVEPVTAGELAPTAPCPMPDQIARFQKAIAAPVA